MNTNNLISAKVLCAHYDIEISFVDSVSLMGLIQIETIEEDHFIHQDHIGDLERIIRLYYELDVNLEGIDIVLNLLEKERDLQNQINTLKNRLSLYEEL